MTRRAEFLAALLLLGLLCGCAKPQQLASTVQKQAAQSPISAPQEDRAAAEEDNVSKDASEEASLPDITPEPEEKEPEKQPPLTWDQRLQALLDADTEPVVLPEQTLPLDEAGACAISQAEAQRPRYQYQGWVSIFSSPLAHLYTLESGERFPPSHLLEPLWMTDAGLAVFDLRDDGAYAKAAVSVWEVRLFDENDPLTSLYIYLDAGTGLVLGAGPLSD